MSCSRLHIMDVRLITNTNTNNTYLQYINVNQHLFRCTPILIFQPTHCPNQAQMTTVEMYS